MSDGYWIFLAICVGIVIFQVLYTRSHNKNLDEYTKRTEEIYRRNGGSK